MVEQPVEEVPDDWTRRVLRHRRLEPLRPGDPQTVGSYQLLQRIPGGMADVGKFVARAQTSAEPVIIKLAEADSDARLRDLLRTEVRLARTITSHRVARILDDGEFAGRPYFVQQVAPGQPLDQLLAERPDRRLDLEDAKRLAVGVLEALRDVHSAGIAHADVKPSNVVLGNRGPTLVDFGAARALDAEPATAPLGTPRFLSPEHLRGEALTTSSDVFAWGLLIALCSGGRHAFDPGEVLSSDAYHDKVLARGAKPDLSGVPPSLRPAVAAALQRDPQARASIDDLLRMLSEADVTRTVTARVPLAPSWQDVLTTRFWHDQYAQRLWTAQQWLGQEDALKVYAVGGAVMTALALAISLVLVVVVRALLS